MFITDDGSISLKSQHFDESYHSKFGAVDESKHVFINAGLQEWYHQNITEIAGADLQSVPYKPAQTTSLRQLPMPIHIFEMGFGTGLNAVLALQWAEHTQCPIIYHTIELFPLTDEQLNALNHADFIEKDLYEKVHKIQHTEFYKDDCKGEKYFAPTVNISPNFTICKQQISLLDVQFPDNFFDVIFFDAFSPNVQPELWTESIFQKLYNASRKNAILTTYCVKGEVRRALKSAGFNVEKIPGPIGKREITRAIKK